MKVNKSTLVLAGVSVAAIAAAWIIAGATFFQNHYIPGTVINGVNCTGKSVEEVKELITPDVSDYILPIKYLERETDRISAGRIKLNVETDLQKINDILENQNPYVWLLGLGKNYDVDCQISYDEELFNDLITKLNIINFRNKPNEAEMEIIYTDNDEFIVQDYVYIDEDNSKLTNVISNAVKNLDEEIILQDTECCKKLVSDDKRAVIQASCDKANDFLGTDILLHDDKFEYELDRDTISKWIVFDDQFNVKVDKNKINDYVKMWNTVGSTRKFLTAHGTYVNVEGGDYGWRADTTGLADKIASAVEGCKDAEIPFEVSQWGLDYGVNDIGKTYIEVDLTNQYLYMYLDGALVLKTCVVTGLPTPDKYTPQGTYSIKSVCRNAVLVGADYRCPVSYWMPFNGGIGLHDATWQYMLGGDWYKSQGSHGCVNLSLSAAARIYDEAFAGMPVVCYYYDRLPIYQPQLASNCMTITRYGDYEQRYHSTVLGNLDNKKIADKKIPLGEARKRKLAAETSTETTTEETTETTTEAATEKTTKAAEKKKEADKNTDKVSSGTSVAAN